MRFGAFLLLFFFLLQLSAIAAPVATVSALTGPLSRRVGDAFQPIALRASLNAGDMLRTGPATKATLLFLDGSQVRLNANTTVEITPPAKAGRGHTSLIRAVSGEVWARLRPGRAVQTSSAIAGVRGTVFNIAVADDGTSTLSVFEGEVDFFNEFGAVNVAEAQQSVARPGQAPTQPITIANPGLILEWTLDLERAVVPREMFFVTPDRAAARQQAAAANNANPLAAGELAFDAGDTARAAEFFNAALQVPGADEDAVRARVGFTSLENGDIPAAETQFAQALAVPNASAQARLLANLGMAWLEIARGRAVAAVAAADRAIALDNQSARAHIARGVALMRVPGRAADALQAFDAALTLPAQPATYQARSWRALQLLGQERREEATKEAQQAAKEAPFSALSQGNLALVLMFTGDANGAVRAARFAANLDPDSVAARVALGQSLLAQGDVDKAETEAARAVALDPGLPQARYLLGVAEAGRRDYRHAARELQTALRLAPDFLPAAAALARVETARGRNDEAVNLITQLQERRGKSATTLASLGETLMHQARYKEAEVAYREAVKINPNSAQAWNELARVLDYTNRLNEAIIASQKAVHLAPQVAEYHATLGQIYLYAGLFGQYQREMRLALALDPKNAIALGELGTNDPDFAITLNSVAQALHYDPRVTRWFMRAGVNTEADASFNKDGMEQAVQGRFEELDGRLRFAGSAMHLRQNDSDVVNDTNRFLFTQDYLSYSIDSRTTLLGNFLGAKRSTGLPGANNINPAFNSDDKSSFDFRHSQVSLRRRFGNGHALWLSGAYQSQVQIKSNPDQITFPFTDDFPFQVRPGTYGPGSPGRVLLDFARVDDTYHAFIPEIRADFGLGAYSKRPGTLTLGLARQQFTGHSHFDLAVPGVDLIRGHNDLTFDVGYLQLVQRLSDRLSFVGQLRGQRERQYALVTSGGSEQRSATRGMAAVPSLLLNYQVNRTTALRLISTGNRDEPTTATLSPIETFLTSEPDASLSGDPDRVRTTEVDVERQLGEGEFLKVFAFHTNARNLAIGSDVPVLNPQAILLDRARSSGLGVRYEKRLTPRLFANTTVVLRRSRGLAPGQPYHGDTLPYEPRYGALLGLDYVHPKGNKFHLTLGRSGSFYADDPLSPAAARPRASGRWDAGFLVEIEPSLHHRIAFGVSNLFNQRGLEFANYPGPGRVFFVSLSRRQ